MSNNLTIIVKKDIYRFGILVYSKKGRKGAEVFFATFFMAAERKKVYASRKEK